MSDESMARKQPTDSMKTSRGSQRVQPNIKDDIDPSIAELSHDEVANELKTLFTDRSSMDEIEQELRAMRSGDGWDLKNGEVLLEAIRAQIQKSEKFMDQWQAELDREQISERLLAMKDGIKRIREEAQLNSCDDLLDQIDALIKSNSSGVSLEHPQKENLRCTNKDVSQAPTRRSSRRVLCDGVQEIRNT